MTSIFSTYSQGENRVTSTIIEVLRNLPINVVENFLIMLSDDELESFFTFKNQPKNSSDGSVPDAEISSNFRLLFETKTKVGAIDSHDKQLEEHLKILYNSKEKKGVSKLVYLTPDSEKPKALVDLDKDVVWKSFQDVYDSIEELFEETSLILSERDQFLLLNLQSFFQQEGLLPIKDQVLIIPARQAWPVYKKFGVYICQPNRNFRYVSHIAFYADSEIKNQVAKIQEGGICESFDFLTKDGIKGEVGRNFSDYEKKDELIEKLSKWKEWKVKEHPNENLSALKVIDLSKSDDRQQTIKLDHSLEHKKKPFTDKKTAFVQRQRYTTIEALKKAKSTSDLEIISV